MNTILISEFDLNLPPSYFGDVLLLSHMIATGINFPGALSDFNTHLVEALTLNFGWLVFHSDEVLTNELKPSLANIGYQSINIRTSVFCGFILTKILLIISTVSLFFIKNKTKVGSFHLKKSYVRILEHVSTPCFTSFEMSSQIM